MKLDSEFRDMLKQTCRNAAHEIGAENLRGLSWFYKNTLRVEQSQKQAA